MILLIEHFKLEDIQKLVDVPGAQAYWAVNTCWWTADSKHLYRGPGGLTMDPRGSVLMQAGLGGFLESAEKNIEHYGRHGLRAFMAAYHMNIVSEPGMNPTSFESWAEYNRLIDDFERSQVRGG